MKTMEYSRRFGGIARLYGEQALVRANAAHVVVIGIGGVGSWAVEAFARSGIGELTLIDLDHINESNINRQIHALDTTLGAAKGLVMQARIKDINPDCVVHVIEEFIDEHNVATLLPACDVVIDAIDNVHAKASLIAHCQKMKIRIVTTGAAGGRTDPTQIEVIDLSRTVQDALASKVRAKLRKDYGFPRDPKQKFGVDCVFSPEQLAARRWPPAKRNPSHAEPVSTNSQGPGFDPAAGLACAGYGSSVAVTAGFGFAAAAKALADLLQ